MLIEINENLYINLGAAAAYYLKEKEGRWHWVFDMANGKTYESAPFESKEKAEAWMLELHYRLMSTIQPGGGLHDIGKTS